MLPMFTHAAPETYQTGCHLATHGLVAQAVSPTVNRLMQNRAIDSHTPQSEAACGPPPRLPAHGSCHRPAGAQQTRRPGSGSAPQPDRRRCAGIASETHNTQHTTDPHSRSLKKACARLLPRLGSWPPFRFSLRRFLGRAAAASESEEPPAASPPAWPRAGALRRVRMRWAAQGEPAPRPRLAKNNC